MTVDELLENEMILNQKIANNSDGIKKNFLECITECRQKIRDKYAAHDLEDFSEGLNGWEDVEMYDLAKLIGMEQAVRMCYMFVFGVQAFTDLMAAIIISESEEEDEKDYG